MHALLPFITFIFYYYLYYYYEIECPRSSIAVAMRPSYVDEHDDTPQVDTAASFIGVKARIGALVTTAGIPCGSTVLISGQTSKPLAFTCLPVPFDHRLYQVWESLSVSVDFEVPRPNVQIYTCVCVYV